MKRIGRNSMTSIEGPQNYRVGYTDGNPWDEVAHAGSEKAREEAALRSGLPAHSSWREINEAGKR